MAYIPDCNNPTVRAQLPETLCTYPPEVIAAICARQPSLCQPYSGAEQPSIFEPIFGTAEAIGNKILSTSENVGTGVLGTLDFASSLSRFLPYLLIIGGIYYITKKG